MNKKAFIAALCGVAISLCQQTWANTRVDLSSVSLEVTPHELALVQVMSEICPPLLNSSQRLKFTQAYQSQLRAFMPNLDPTAVMQQISGQAGYRNILSSIRAWTLSYPTAENRALCVEFSESSF